MVIFPSFSDFFPVGCWSACFTFVIFTTFTQGKQRREPELAHTPNYKGIKLISSFFFSPTDPFIARVTNIWALSVVIRALYLGIQCQLLRGWMISVSGDSSGGGDHTRYHNRVASWYILILASPCRLVLHRTTPLSWIYDVQHAPVHSPQANPCSLPRPWPWFQQWPQSGFVHGLNLDKHEFSPHIKSPFPHQGSHWNYQCHTNVTHTKTFFYTETLFNPSEDILSDLFFYCVKQKDESLACVLFTWNLLSSLDKRPNGCSKVFIVPQKLEKRTKLQ